MTASRARMGWMVALGLGLLIAMALWQAPSSRTPPPQPTPPDRLFQPDVVIQSQALSQLPRDLLAVPLLNTLLTEEWVFYYEQNESRLSLEGAFRRLAYERNLGVGDEIIAYALNTPAQLALWKNRDGKLKDYLLVLPKQGLLRWVEAATRVALKDPQLSGPRLVINLTNNDITYTHWRIEYAPNQAIHFVALPDHLLVLTDPTLLATDSEPRRAIVTRFLTQLGPQATPGEWMGLPPTPHRHTIAVHGSYLSFGYHHFFPSLEKMRFEYDGTHWSTALFAANPLAANRELWQRLPADPALCLALPLDKTRLRSYLATLTPHPELAAMVDHLRPPAALCWYGDSRLHTPIALLPLENPQASWYPLLGDLFTRTVGTREADGALLPVASTPCPGGQGTVWRRPVSSPHALQEAEEGPLQAAMRSKRFFTVTLALCQETLILTPDRILADRTLGVLQKTYPPLAEVIPPSLPPLSVAIAPQPLANLLRQALRESLPPATEAVFRTSVEQRFFPLLDKIGALPTYVLATPRQHHSWEPLAWHALSAP